MNGSFRRAATRGALASLALFGLPALATDEFRVSEAQMRSLGITLQTLAQPRPIAGQTYPAQVAVPRSAERVISAPVEGMVSQVLVDENTPVKAGQALLRFDSPGFGALQLKLLEAAAAERLAETALARARMLLSEGVIAQRRLDEAEAAAGNARAQLVQAKAAVRLAGVDEPAIDAVAGGKKLLDALIIRTKQAGTVLRIDVKPGQRVAAGDLLMRLGDLEQLWLEIQIPAEQARRVQDAGAITVVGREASAEALSVGATVGESQTVMLRANVSSGAQRLRPGEFVQVQVPFADSRNAWALPLGAVAYRDKNAYVFVHTPEGFIARPVTVVASAGQSVNVNGELKSGDAVAVSGVIALKGAWLGEGGDN